MKKMKKSERLSFVFIEVNVENQKQRTSDFRYKLEGEVNKRGKVQGRDILTPNIPMGKYHSNLENVIFTDITFQTL